MVVDIYHDILARKSIGHIISDILITLVVALSTALAWLYLRSRIREERERPAIPGVETALKAWGLTPAEVDVALWIVRGLNFYQIADLLGKSERTVRQQAIAIYAKAGFRNRSEFTGHFVETLYDLKD